MNTQSNRTALGLIVGTVAATVAFAGSAVAAPQSTNLLELRVVNEVVESADLDLASAGGAARMARRVEQAADRVCGGGPLRQGSPRLAACRRRAIVTAMARIDAPLVQQALGLSPARTTMARR